MSDGFQTNIFMVAPIYNSIDRITVKLLNLDFRRFSKHFSGMSRNFLTPCNQALTFGVSMLMTLRMMLTKRKILLILGVVVAIVIGLYTGLFGMSAI